MRRDFDTTSDVRLDGVTVLTVSGEIDLYSAPELDERLRSSVSAGAKHVIVDLSACAFLDSSALHVLARANWETDGSCRLSLVVPADSPVHKVFEITRFEEVVPIHPALDSALEQV